MSRLTVRLATAADAEALCVVNVRSIVEICGKDYSAERVMAWCANKQPASYLKWLADPKLRLYAGEIDGVVAGVALLDINGWVFLLYVTPETLGAGLGKAMLRRLEEDAVALGLERLQLKSTVTAREFYERQGYTNHGPSDDEMPSFRMEKWLNGRAPSSP